jgi:hypothetical protein
MSRLIHVLRAAVPALALAAASACQAAPGSGTPTASADAAKAAPAAHAHKHDRSPVDNALPLVLVHKSPTCGCCKGWVEHMRASGFTVEVEDTAALQAVKERVGVPAGKASCHTSEVGGYFVEGHVPAEDIVRLLKEKPKARGITAPGMPIGSPGMEVHGQGNPHYVVELVREDGSTEVFAEHGEGAPKVEGEHAGHDHAH